MTNFELILRKYECDWRWLKPYLSELDSVRVSSIKRPICIADPVELV